MLRSQSFNAKRLRHYGITHLLRLGIPCIVNRALEFVECLDVVVLLTAISLEHARGTLCRNLSNVVFVPILKILKFLNQPFSRPFKCSISLAWKDSLCYRCPAYRRVLFGLLGVLGLKPSSVNYGTQVHSLPLLFLH